MPGYYRRCPVAPLPVRSLKEVRQTSSGSLQEVRKKSSGRLQEVRQKSSGFCHGKGSTPASGKLSTTTTTYNVGHKFGLLSLNKLKAIRDWQAF